MQSAAERRLKIAEYISGHRHVQISELMDEFHVSNATIRRDVEILSCSYPISTTVGKYGSGIHADDGWYITRRTLSEKQECLLRRILPNLQGEEKQLMQSILDAFAKPVV